MTNSEDYSVKRKYTAPKGSYAEISNKNIDALLVKAERVKHIPWSELERVKRLLAPSIKKRLTHTYIGEYKIALRYTDTHVWFQNAGGFVPCGWLPLQYANTVDS